MVIREGGLAKSQTKRPSATGRHQARRPEAVTPNSIAVGTETAQQLALHPADAPNTPKREVAVLTQTEKADQTAFFQQALDIMAALEQATTPAELVKNVQLWIAAEHTSTDEWYQAVGQRLRSYFFIEDLFDLTETERSAVTKFMSKAKLSFDHKPLTEGSSHRRSWIARIIGKQ